MANKRKDSPAAPVLPAPVMQSPESPSAAADGTTAPAPASEGDSEVVKRQVAKHELLDSNGAVVEAEESANGIRYTLLAVPNKPFEYQFGKSPAADKMLAIFGAKTLATNETSQARNNAKGAATPEEQILAVHERFDLICGSEPKWVDRTREGVGAKVDKDAMAEAICRVLVVQGKLTDEQVAAGYKAKVRDALENGVPASGEKPAKSAAQYARDARSVDGVTAEYAKLIGRQTKTADDLLSAVSL